MKKYGILSCVALVAIAAMPVMCSAAPPPDPEAMALKTQKTEYQDVTLSEFAIKNYDIPGVAFAKIDLPDEQRAWMLRPDLPSYQLSSPQRAVFGLPVSYEEMVLNGLFVTARSQYHFGFNRRYSSYMISAETACMTDTEVARRSAIYRQRLCYC